MKTQKVERAAAKAAVSRTALIDAMREARAEGQTLRVIAEASGFSVEWVRRLTSV